MDNTIKNNIDLENHPAPVEPVSEPTPAPVEPVSEPTPDQDVEKKTINMLIECISTNLTFFSILAFCLIKLKQSKPDSSYIKLGFSLFAAAGLGYFSHYLSHKIDYTKFYSECDNIFTRNKYSDFILKIYAKFLDFHQITHHDSSINKNIINILYEFIVNLLFQGFAIVIFVKLIDIRVFILWAIAYATIHNINYILIPSTTHRDHHADFNTNYGYDIVDILLNTKYDSNDVENINHYSINYLIITYLIIHFMS